MIIYKLTNIINNKIYIGQTIRTLQYRISCHFSEKRGCCKLLFNAIRKYGKENFTSQILETCDSIEQLNEREIYWIKLLKSTDRSTGYNIQEGGKNRRISEEHKKRISEANKGKKLTLEQRKAISERQKGKLGFMKGKSFTEEHKRKIGESNTGKKRSPEICRAMSNRMKGRVPSNKGKTKHIQPIIHLQTGKIYSSVIDAADSLNLNKKKIIRLLMGYSLTVKRQTFKYL